MMRVNIHKIVYLAVLNLIVAAPVLAQNGGFAGSALRMGFGPRAISMSNAMSASTSEGIYPYYNPALAAVKSDFRQFDLSASSLQFDRLYSNAGFHLQLPPNAGIAIGLIRSGVKEIDARSLSGYPLGSFDLSEYQLNTTFGLRFSDRFYGGVSFKISYANYKKEITPSTSVGVDIGFLYRITQSLNLGLTVQDMFAGYSWNTGNFYNQSQSRNVVNSFPTRYKIGLAYQHELFAITSEYEVQSLSSETNAISVFIQQDGSPTFIRSLKNIGTNTSMLRLGGAWYAHERFTLRAGYQRSDLDNSDSNSLSAGFSVSLPVDKFSPSIDYAFVREPYGVANMHVFALRLHL